MSLGAVSRRSVLLGVLACALARSCSGQVSGGKEGAGGVNGCTVPLAENFDPRHVTYGACFRPHAPPCREPSRLLMQGARPWHRRSATVDNSSCVCFSIVHRTRMPCFPRHVIVPEGISHISRHMCKEEKPLLCMMCSQQTEDTGHCI